MKTINIIDKLDNYIIRKNNIKTDEYAKTALSPTDANQCNRKVFYKWNKYPVLECDAQSLRIFSMGDYIHERWQNTLEEMGLQLKKEHYIDDSYKGVPIHGYVDSICLIDNKPVIVELKSLKEWNYSYQFGKKKGTKNYLTEAKLEHISQVMLYMHFTGIHDSIILYENKNTSELKEFHIIYDESMALEILNNFVKLYQQINLNQLPERFEGAKKDTYPCSYCGYKELCFEKIKEN